MLRHVAAGIEKLLEQQNDADAGERLIAKKNKMSQETRKIKHKQSRGLVSSKKMSRLQRSRAKTTSVVC
jgi:hypothetical protein